MKVYKLDENHLQVRCDWLNHPNIYRYMNIQFPINLIETKKWFERIVGQSSRIDLVFIEGEEIVSMTGLTGLDLSNGLIEFYIMVNPDIQGRGYGHKCTEFTLNFAFANFNIHKVYLYTNSFNERANNLYLKLGFQLEGVLRKHKFKNGELIDRCIYGLLKSDWLESNYMNKNIDLQF